MVTLVVEDGTGLANANSYVSLVEADTYFTNQGTAGAAWAAPDALKNEYLANACTALDAVFGRNYISYLRASDTTIQSLLWPRENVWDRHNRRIPAGGIPQEVKDAQCELALLLQSGVDLFPEGNPNNNLLSESVAIGEISQSYTLQRQAAEQATYEGFRKVELILWPILKPKARKMRFAL
jgi:hypothetical protein